MSHHAVSHNEKRLRNAGIINILIPSVQLIIGYLTGSVAVRSEGLHNSEDGASDLLAWQGARLSRRPPDNNRTYGYHRAGILTATAIALVLLVSSVAISLMAYHRLFHPEKVNGYILIGVGVSSLILNFGTTLYLSKGNRLDINLFAALLHAVVDGIGSFFTVLAGVIIVLTHYYPADAWCSFVLAGLMAWTAYRHILKKTINELLEGSPPGINADEMSAHIMQELQFSNIHDVHPWKFGQFNIVTLHMVLDNPETTLAEVDKRRVELERCLSNHYKIDHITIQPEAVNCQI